MKLNKKSFSGVRIVRAGELEPGAVSEEQFWLLVDISPIHSEKIILALKDYFVSGYWDSVIWGRCLLTALMPRRSTGTAVAAGTR
ncbi:PapB/FocB family fimbrial expression transcriptional regulator [Salmonella enterica]